MLSRALQAAAGNGISTVAVAEAIDFDGSNDELSRATDLTGNTDGKTFTFSCWLWRGEIGSNQRIYYSLDSQYGLYIQPDTSNNLIIYGYNSANTQILNATVTVPFQVGFTFINILISVDMANTANRAVYINDVAATVTWTTYTNAAINFTCPTHKVGQALKGRLSNVFLDYTYRDLSIEANRRLFVTADLKPAAGQAALNPILYLPMDDPTQPGLNAGTGGDFTLTGVVARSGRGPNQYNAPMSYFTAGDSLTKTTTYNSKTITIAFNARPETASAVVFYVNSGGTKTFIQLRSTEIRVYLYNSAGVVIGLTNIPYTPTLGRNLHFVLSVDMANTSNRHVAVNGSIVSTTWTTYTNDFIDFNGTTTIDDGTNCNIGALWFNTSYIDLSQAANLAKFVTGTGIDAKPVDLGANGELPTGTSPLIYLPMYGNNAGKNYGTGGDFTVNSGPYTGARGPNEFWGNKADFDGTTGYLSKASLSGIADSKTFSVSFFVQPDSTGQYFLFSTTNETIRVDIRPTTGRVGIQAKNSGGTSILNALSSASTSTSSFRSVMISIDLADTAKRTVVIDGVVDASVTWTTYTNDTIDFTVSTYYIGSDPALSVKLDGKLSEFYFTTDYIDFSQEANRLKFRDAFGNPVDLTQQIEDGAIPNPAIYMRFPPTAFGTNYGTGGDFTVNGTISDGGQL